jgi:RNA-directed DNA polymerase
MDLSKCFDLLDHELIIQSVRRRVTDGSILNLIKLFLTSGVMVNGCCQSNDRGSPQGGVISPLLSNIYLDAFDQEMKRRDHRIVRYADDIVIFVRSELAGLRVFDSVKHFIETKLKLVVSDKKSAVALSSSRTFLGYTVGSQGRLRIDMLSRKRLLVKLNGLLHRARGRALYATIAKLNLVLRGWAVYYKLASAKKPLDTIDGWVRRRLRCIIWRQWKRPWTREKHLFKLGLSRFTAWKSSVNGRGPWWNAGASHMNRTLPKVWFLKSGLVSVLDVVTQLQRVS